MSNIFRDSESLGKINGNKWSQNKKKNTNKGVKSPQIFFIAHLGLINHLSLSQSSQDLYGIGATIRIGQEMLCLPTVVLACLIGLFGTILWEKTSDAAYFFLC